ncbi:MAG: molybdopterin-binding/glycosyltransferase family 2 protein [Pseudomonadota bacterium]
MKFGPVAVSEAVGGILAHSVKAGGQNLKKGRTLVVEDLDVLGAAGLSEVIVARLDDGDIHEDEAAQLMASALTGAHVSPAEPFTGRANLYADAEGLALVDEESLRAINRLDERLTIATLPAYEPVSLRQMLATVKIIPFALPRSVIDAALDLTARAAPIVSVAPFSVSTVDLVITKLPQLKASMIEKTEQVVRGRLERCGARLGQVILCDHSEEAVAGSIAQKASSGAPLLLFGASAIVDRNDVIPAALERAGGEVVHLGMPVDPGNLLMLGRFGSSCVIGVPSCARSPKLNGFDWVLQRVLAGLDVGAHDLMDMGAGGLLKEIPSRPRPRELHGDEMPVGRRSAKIAAVILAAGRSTRMGPENKLLKPIDGEALVARTVRQLTASGANPTLVVTGHEDGDVRQALVDADVVFIHNPAYRDGLSASLKAGIAAVPGDADGALVALGDMPNVGPQVVDKLISAFNPAEGRSICVPLYKGKRGNPVLWGAEFFGAIKELSGDIGAKHLLADYPEAVCEVEVDDKAVLLDLDTPEAFAAYELA